MKNGVPHKLFSMKLGAVGLSERFIASNPPKNREIKALQTEIGFALEHPLRKIKNERWQISSGSSGTILNLSSMLNFETAQNIQPKNEIQLKKLAALNKNLAEMPLEKRATLPVISPQRAEVIVAGGQILEGVMRALKIETLQPCAFALREGVIIDYLRQIEAESLPPVPDVEDIRLRDVFAVGRRYGYEESHALQVAQLAENIFDALAPVYNLKRHGRTLLSAAALLHDVGYHVSHEEHHKHSFYLIKHAEMTGFSETERNIIANIARYHRGALPKEKHLSFMELSDRDRRTVMQMGAILRIAEALDRGHESHVVDMRFKLEKHNLFLKLVGSEEDCAVERKAVELKKDLFEAAYDCTLVVL
jgi:exopolyphosphatase/guanosine-5'-triphosphate,3'-diphosphate pyrophosphatase